MNCYPRLSSLIGLAFEVNAAIDEKNDDRFTFDEIYQGLERGSLLRDLENKLTGVIDLGFLMIDDDQHCGLVKVLKTASEAFEGRERRKVGVEHSGLTLLMAIILEAIQQQNWTTPYLNPLSANEIAAVLRGARQRSQSCPGVLNGWDGHRWDGICSQN